MVKDVQGNDSNNIGSDFKKEVRKQATQQAAKWTLAAVGGLIVLAAAGWWIVLERKVQAYIHEAAGTSNIASVPTGAVVAFSLENGCPKGWSNYTKAYSKFIMGASPEVDGEAEKARIEGRTVAIALTPRLFGTQSGEEAVTLQMPQIPNHNHTIKPPESTYNLNHGTNQKSGSNTGKSVVLAPYWFPHNTASPLRLKSKAKEIVSENQVGTTGQHHNNIPPYIALYYCKKN